MEKLLPDEEEAIKDIQQERASKKCISCGQVKDLSTFQKEFENCYDCRRDYFRNQRGEKHIDRFSERRYH